MNEITPHDAFTPALEVQDIDRFAGRADELGSMSDALQSKGAQLVIYGQRGIGKSSLARALIQLASGEKAILERLKVKPTVQFDYLPVYFACDDSVTSIDRLLLRLLTDSAALADWVPYKIVEKKTIGEVGGKIKVGVIELKGGGQHSVTERQSEVETDVVSIFTNACKTLAASSVAKNGLLIVIDEFDRIKDASGIASLLKTLGPERVTFALVGVATTIHELIKEHESVARQLADGAIPVRPMSDADLHEIIRRAMQLLGGKYTFDAHASNWIVSLAKGHPFYVHLVAKHALLTAIARGSTVVTTEDAKNALASIALKGSAPIQETTYKTAIGHSYVREYVLKQFAQRNEDEIHTTELYAEIAKSLNIDPSAVSVYVGQLGSEKYGAVLEKTRDRYYRFPDSLLKAYAAARPFQLKQGDKDTE